MKRFLGMDTKAYRFFSFVWNMLVLNLLTLLMCVPVVTAGASLTAMHYVMLAMVRGEEGYVSRMFWKSFKSNLKQSTILWLAFAALFASYRFDWYMAVNNPDIFKKPVLYGILILAVLTFMLLQTVFPLQSHFENTAVGTVRNALILTVSFFPRILVMALVWVIPYEILTHSLVMFPLVVMLGFTFPGFVMAKLYDPIFRRREPEEEDPDPEQ